MRNHFTATVVIACLYGPAAFAQSNGVMSAPATMSPAASPAPASVGTGRPALAGAPASDASASGAGTTNAVAAPLSKPASGDADPAPVDPARLAKGMAGSEARASKWIGAHVYGPDDKSIGQVDDLVFDQASGQLGEAILGVGGFLGIGEKRVAVPLAQLKVGPDNRLSVALTKDQLKSAPSFTYADAGRKPVPTDGAIVSTGDEGPNPKTVPTPR